jgi:hypothetical protein
MESVARALRWNPVKWYMNSRKSPLSQREVGAVNEPYLMLIHGDDIQVHLMVADIIRIFFHG